MLDAYTIELLKGLKRGHEKSFSTLFDLYRGELYRYCAQVIDDTTEAEDILQDIFSEVWESRTQFCVEISLRAYLFGILKKKLLKHFRNQGIRKRHLEILKMTVLQNNHAGESPLQTLIGDDLWQNLLNELRVLPLKEREVFILSQIDGYTVKEISDHFNTSEQTVRNQINNATRKATPIVTKLLS